MTYLLLAVIIVLAAALYYAVSRIRFWKKSAEDWERGCKAEIEYRRITGGKIHKIPRFKEPPYRYQFESLKDPEVTIVPPAPGDHNDPRFDPS